MVPRIPSLWWAAVAASGLLLGAPAGAAPAALEYHAQTLSVDGRSYRVVIPRGLTASVLTTALDGPRLLTFGPDRHLFIGSRSGSVYRLAPPYTRPEVLVELDDYPHSVAFRKGEILVARRRGVYRAAYDHGRSRLAARDFTLLAALPGGGGHNSRTVRVGPDGRVYASLGIRGNCSNEYLGSEYSFQHRRGGVLVLDETGDTPRWTTYAAGLRNPVGFDWHPATGVMYASNNGPDHMGFELPPEYFSRLDRGSFHGMPWFQFDGARLRRDTCIQGPAPRPPAEVSLPVATFPARSAPMAVAFVPPGALTRRFEGDAVVALHGSWATLPLGTVYGDPATRRHPKMVVVRFDKGDAVRVDALMSGFQLENGTRWARPVGAAIGPDGALYFTSDSGLNALFRLAPEQ